MNSVTRKTTVAGLLGAMTVVLAVSPIGRIPLPWTGIVVTTMHLPAIIGGLLEGPAVGAGVGLIFGAFSWLVPSTPFFANPLISVLPRLLIGPMAYLAYRATGRAAWAAVAGTATNTVGVLGLIALCGYLPWQAVLGIAATNGVFEVILAAVVVSLFHQKVKATYGSNR